MLIDNHTRVAWVYLLKEKHEVESMFKNFYNMVQTQLHTSIQIFKSDNKRKYFANVLGKIFEEKGIVPQSSCNNTPQQNEVAERQSR